MIDGATLAAVIGATAALFLAWRGLGARRLPPRTALVMAAAWVAIIAGLALAVSTLGE